MIFAETSVGNPMACGVGRGKQCCIFLTLDNGGWTCMRGYPFGDELKERHKAGLLNAGRVPTEGRPQCQRPAWDEGDE